MSDPSRTVNTSSLHSSLALEGSRSEVSTEVFESNFVVTF